MLTFAKTMPIPTVTVARHEAGRETTVFKTEQQLVPALGRALLEAVLRVAATRARRICVSQCRAAKRSGTAPTKAQKRETTRWLLVEGLARCLAKDLVQSGRSSWTAEMPDDVIIPAARLLVAWVLREERIVREPLGDKAGGSKAASASKAPRFNRRGMKRKRHDYSAARAGNGSSAPEHPKHDPFDKLHSMRCTELAGLASVSGIAAALTETWKRHGAFFEALPRDVRLALLLAALVALDAKHDVRARALDRGMDAVLDSAILAARVRAVEATLNKQLSVRDGMKGRVVAAATEAVLRDSSAWLLTTEMHRANATDAVEPFMERITARMVERAEEIAATYAENELERSIVAVHAKTIEIAGEAAREFGDAAPDLAKQLERVLASRRARALTASVLDRIGEDEAFAAVEPQTALDLHWGSAGERAVGELRQMFTASDVWDVAVPITNWRTDVPTAPAGPFARVDDVQRAWGVNTFRPRSSTPGSIAGVATDSPCIVSAGVAARDVETARDVAIAEAKGLVAAAWFAINDTSAAFVHDAVIARSADTTTTSLYQRASALAPLGELDAPRVKAAGDVIDLLRQALADSERSATMQRIVDAIAFYQRSLGATELHERYINLWFALETLFGNLESDTEEYERAVPIGTRVAYRCAMLWKPDASLTGKTWGVARWAMTIELQSLYELRCATVHEGQLRPVADDVMLRRFLAAVSNVLSLALATALDAGLKSVEDLLAWIEDRYRPGAVIA